MMMEKNKRNLFILGLIGVLVVIVILVFSWGKKAGQEAMVDNIKENNTPANSPKVLSSKEEIELARLIESSTAEAPGASLISPEKKVINLQGEVTKTDVDQIDPLAPTQTGPIEIDQVGNEVYQLNLNNNTFSPSELKVRANEPITISLGSKDDKYHNIVFDDPFLQAITISVAPGEVRAITFNAPPKGSYTFYCNVGGDRIGHASRGEIGVMIAE